MGARNMMDFSGRPAIRTGAYSQSGELVAGNPNGGAVNLQAAFYTPDDPRQRPGGIYTVHFNVRGLREPTANPPIKNFLNPVATVVFTAEGNDVQRRFSVVNGTSISGICDHIDVRVVDESLPPIAGELKYVVSVTVAPWTRPARPEAPPYLRGGTNLSVAPAASLAVPVPVDAGVTSACVFVSGGIPLVTMRDDRPVVLATYPIGNNEPKFIPLVPETADLLLVNGVGAPDNAVFSVLFGIDG